MSIKLADYLKTLEDNRKSVHDKIKLQADELAKTHEYVKSQLKPEDADYEARMKSFQDALAGQKELRKELTGIEEVIEGLAVEEYSAMSTAKSVGLPLLSPSIVGVLSNTTTKNREERNISHLGDDIAEYIVRHKLNNSGAMKSRKGTLPVENIAGGGTFTPVLEFHVGFGETDILEDEELVSNSELKPTLEKYKARKSMFTQHPLAGGQTVLGVGDEYNPEGVFEGNTGGIFEYTIDRELYNMPYAPMGIMDVLKTQPITGNSHHFIRQTVRINNAKPLLDSITTPPVNFVQTKPLNEYGWTLFKTYVMTYAAAVILSDEVEEDAKPIADAVRDQLGKDVMRVFANSLANGVNTTSNPDITGLFNLAGVNTRIHRSTAAYVAPLNTTTPSASTATDDVRETFERAVLDLQRWGFSPDYILTSWAIMDKMRFIRNVGTEERRYNDQELMTVSGAKIVAGSEVPATKAMVGDFDQAVRALIRTGLTIQVGYINDQFVTDQFTVRARVRGGLKAMRPYALERITFV